MLPFRVNVKNGNKMCDMGLVEPGECSVISIINDAKREFLGDGIQTWEKWELRIVFPWNGLEHTVFSDEELMFVFEEFDRRNNPIIHFHISVVPLENDNGLLGYTPNTNPQETVIQENTNPQTVDITLENPTLEEDAILEVDDDSNEVDGSDVEPDYEYQPLGSVSDSDTSLVDSLDEGHDMGGIPGRCEPDGDKFGWENTSGEEDGPTRMVRYCIDNEWTPNSDGSISLRAGQIFSNAKEVRDVIRRFAIQEGFQLKKLKNDKSRYTVRCLNEDCDWRVHASTMIDGITFIIRSITGGHSLCQRQQMNREANSKWIAAAFGALILSNPSIEAAVIKNELRDKFGVQASSQSIYRAKKRVLKNLRADHIEAYAMIWRYANMCIVMNPGTYAKVNTQEIIGENPRFQRLFLSFRAMQTGFVNGCRPLIGIDGCHLTSEYGGVLLAATALDADNGIFPIAYAVCETECKESWIWFLRLLHEALDWDDNRRICFMSDRQKGILAALKSEWPTAKNRYCFRHVFANYNNKFKSLDLRKKVWRAAKVGHVAGFNDVMKEIREVSEKAHTWLMKSKPHKWARHKFEEEIKSDHVTNNMSECFNSWIKEDRDKPILTLFETLRRKVMVRFTDKWVEIEKLNDTITSYTRNRLNETDKEARKLQVIHGRGEYHETMDSRNKPWLVNIGEKTCDCGEWQISGCPCMHALAVLTYNRQHAHDFVHWYYSKEAFQATYSGAINPIPDASRWPTVDNVPLDPPLRRILVGRPKKNRRKEPDEGPAAGRIFSNKCKKCGTIGHNKRTCTGNGGSK